MNLWRCCRELSGFLTSWKKKMEKKKCSKRVFGVIAVVEDDDKLAQLETPYVSKQPARHVRNLIKRSTKMYTSPHWKCPFQISRWLKCRLTGQNQVQGGAESGSYIT